VVKPGGRIASLEFGVPSALPLRALWQLYTRAALPVIGRLVSRDWQRVGGFLGPSIAGFYREHPLGRIVGLWQQAGIEDVRVRRMSFGAGVVMSGTRAADAAAADVG